MNTLRKILQSSSHEAAVHFERAAFTAAHAAATKDLYGGAPGVAEVVRELWPEDRATPLILRAAVNPADTSSAAALASVAVSDFVASLTPLSAAARLISAGIKADLDGIAATTIPRRHESKPNADASWIPEGGPIPARQYDLDGVTLGPVRRLAVLSCVTRELAERTSGEAVVATLLREDTASSLDAALFSSAPANGQPAGLLAGLTPISASAASDNTAAMIADLEALAGAIADAGGSGEIVFIAAPRQAVSARLRLGTNRGVTVWTSSALAAGTVLAVQPDAFVSAFGPVPRITAGLETAIHMNTEAAALSTAGPPNAVAAPVVSTFQQDLIALRCILDAAWTMRATGRVAVITDAAWGSAP
jgi:hypothetical protein